MRRKGDECRRREDSGDRSYIYIIIIYLIIYLFIYGQIRYSMHLGFLVDPAVMGKYLLLYFRL